MWIFFLLYCTCRSTIHPHMVSLYMSKNPLRFDTINAMALKGLHHFTIQDFLWLLQAMSEHTLQTNNQDTILSSQEVNTTQSEKEKQGCEQRARLVELTPVQPESRSTLLFSLRLYRNVRMHIIYNMYSMYTIFIKENCSKIYFFFWPGMSQQQDAIGLDNKQFK